MRMLGAAALLLVVATTAAGCGGGGGDALTVYSGRSEALVGPLLEQFEEQTGIETKVRYGDSAELAATIAEEGGNSPADVFFAQDAGSLGAVAEEGLLAPLPESVLSRVPVAYRDSQGRWVGTSGRARVVAYNTALAESQLPDSIWEYADPHWRGRIGLAPTNASFQAMVTAMRLAEGEERTREWLETISANEPSFYENNVQAIEAVASGEVDVAFVNHYYLYGLLAEQPAAAVANHYLAPGDAGSLVNVAGAGILASSERPAEAEQLVAYLLSDEGQRFFATETDEYPLVAGIESGAELPPIESLNGPDIPLGDFGSELERTLELLADTGFTS